MATTEQRAEGQQRYTATAIGLVLLAWLILAVWSASPYACWMDHGRAEELAAPLAARLAVFTLGWTLMVVATMLPGALLLLARGTDHASLRSHRLAAFVLAYLAVWTIFGGLSYLGDRLLHELVEQAPALADVVAPAVVLLAGLYQLTHAWRPVLVVAPHCPSIDGRAGKPGGVKGSRAVRGVWAVAGR